jgi:hypothetical protein
MTHLRVASEQSWKNKKQTTLIDRLQRDQWVRQWYVIVKVNGPEYDMHSSVSDRAVSYLPRETHVMIFCIRTLNILATRGIGSGFGKGQHFLRYIVSRRRFPVHL